MPQHGLSASLNYYQSNFCISCCKSTCIRKNTRAFKTIRKSSKTIKMYSCCWHKWQRFCLCYATKHIDTKWIQNSIMSEPPVRSDPALFRPHLYLPFFLPFPLPSPCPLYVSLLLPIIPTRATKELSKNYF